MKPHLLLLLTVALWGGGGRASPLLYNVSMDGSGDGGELELLFPTAYATRVPASAPSPTLTPSLTGTITTTMIRLKDFVLSRVVDFLQENLLIIIVVSSLLIVMVFIICCASAMSHKRKLDAYNAPAAQAARKTAEKTAGAKGELQDRPYAVDHVKRVQSVASPKNLRVPSKALVGERGRDARSSPRPEVRKVKEAEEVEKRREEPQFKAYPKPREEREHQSSGPVVCNLATSRRAAITRPHAQRSKVDPKGHTLGIQPPSSQKLSTHAPGGK